LWRSPAFEGELLNIDARGVRRTPGGECSPGALKVYALGGSAMWGWGAPDWGTIPAYLQRELSASLDEPVCVVNYAEQAFVSTQDLVQLQLLLAAGEVPDHVILYSGVNDVFAAEQNGAPLLHQNLQDIVTRFERPGPSLLSWLMARSTVRLAQTAVSVLGLGRGGSEDSAGRGLENGPAGDGSSTEELADAVVDAYVRGYESVAALAEAFGFGYDVVWQPHILIGGEPLTAEEQEMPAGLSWVVTLSPRLVELFRLTSGRVQVEAAVHEHLHYLGDAFDEVEAQLWIDTWGHVTPEGNEIVAGHLASLLRPSLGR
ncbi:MAG TPA: SGNH/GDSL hydrolase family protein, partial [Longimicrobiales bacterium]|nr:SGNH/GDSL hydrolase family protein [Longimicrobiales bacterium]